MANEEQLEYLLFKGVKAWNIWREENPYEDIDLSNADLSNAILSFANLFFADLSYANLSNANLVEAKLELANLSKANLRNVNLSKAQALAANFDNAILTGVCTEDWNINSKTSFDNVICDYVYLKDGLQERRPSDLNKNFKFGDFKNLFHKSSNTVDLIFSDKIDWRRFLIALQELQIESQIGNLLVQTIERKQDNIYVIRIEAPPNANKGSIEASFWSRYNFLSRNQPILEGQDNNLLLFPLADSSEQKQITSKEKLSVGRRNDIEEQLNKDYELLKNLENRLRTETDPKPELRLNEDIKKLKQQIRQREEELGSLSTSSVPNQNASDNKSSDKESSKVNMTFNAPVYGVAGNVQGNQKIYTSGQNQAHAEAEETQQAEQQQQKILILAAIPHGLRLDREIREIEEAIRRATKRDLFDIRIRTAVRPQDIRRAIAEEKPQIVHFCGHGLDNGYLLLEDDGGNNKPVAPEALALLFKLHTNYVKCVLLNACYSEKPADAISQHIDYVIGMNNPIQDKAAIEFAKGFYDGLGYELSDKQDVFQRAFDEGVVAAQLENISQGQIPILKKKL